MKRHRTLLLLAGLAVLTMGCRAPERQQSAPEDRSTPPAGTQQGSDEAPSASEVAQDVKDAASDLAKKAEGAAESMAPKVDAAKQLTDVKVALMADPNVDGSAIDVDADAATKTIHLKGRVPTAAQKSAAERIARDKAQGWKVHNMLTVGKSAS
jgi:osmotically-inducible protein OsmY